MKLGSSGQLSTKIKLPEVAWKELENNDYGRHLQSQKTTLDLWNN